MKALLAFLLLVSLSQPKVFVADKNQQPGNAQQISNLNKVCPAIKIVQSTVGADYIVAWDSKTWQETTWGGHQQEWFIYNPAGEVVASGMAHKISNAAKDICKALQKAQK
jgi:hypothetical protein